MSSDEDRVDFGLVSDFDIRISDFGSPIRCGFRALNFYFRIYERKKIYRKEEGYMKTLRKKQLSLITIVAMTAVLGGCAGQPQQFVVQQPDEQKPQTITFPNGTMFGGASGSQASTLAQLVGRL